MSKEEQYQKLCEINRVESFDPAAFAVEYTDMNTGEVRKRLPVMIQMAWFRLKYPEGRIAVEVTPAKDCFVAKARVYPSYKDGPLNPALAAEEPRPAQQLRQAMNTPCPIAKYKGKTLGDVLTLDPRAISWVANKFTGNSQISEAAKLLCDYALEQTAS